MKKFKCIAIHASNVCDMEPPCPFCYKKKGDIKPNESLFLRLPKYLKEITNQVACLPESEEIWKYDKGILNLEKIGNLEIGDIIFGEGCFTKVLNIDRKTKNKLYKIKIENGRSFSATEEHIIPTKDGEKRVDNLKVKDRLITNDKFDSDFVKKINLSKFGRVEGNKVIRERYCYRFPVEISTKDIGLLAGFYISEGDSRYFTFGADEKEIAIMCSKRFNEFFNCNSKVLFNKNTSRVQYSKLIGRKIFREELKLGSSSRKKGLGKCLFFDIEGLTEVLAGVFGGDGCVRIRNFDGSSKDKRKGTTMSANLKTSSKRLANEVRLALETRFDLKVSIEEGMNQERELEGRIIKKSNYYSVNIAGNKQLLKILPILRFCKNYKRLIKELNRNKDEDRIKKFTKLHTDNRIKNIEKIYGKFNVVDITVDKPNLYTLRDNILVHNCGGGEITLFPEFVKKFGKECKKHNLILNITSNGRPLMEMLDNDLKELLQEITMISLSHDNYKIKTKKDFKNYTRLVKRIKKITKTQVGCNLLIDKNLLGQNGLKFKKLVDDLFELGIHRVFALCPKNMKCPDILKVKLIYQFLSVKHKHFYIDDATKMVLTENKYSDWKEPCHRGEGLISIDENGGVSSCSFTEPFTYIKKPQDILKIKIPKNEMNCHSCPFLIR